MTVQMIYMGLDHTLVEQVGTREKIKVVPGEIIDVDESKVNRMKLGSFEIYDENAPVVEKKKDEEEKANHVPSLEDFSKGELIGIAVKHGLNLGNNSKGKPITANDSKPVIVGALSLLVDQGIVQGEYDIKKQAENK